MKIQKNSNQIIDLVNKTHVTITKQNLVSSTQFILIAISGGQDSICLFFILLQLKNQWKWDFGVLYCNHFWQTDSFYTSSLIFRVGFIFSIPAYLNLPSENIFSEQKSRNWRYYSFKRLSYFYNYDIIFTGHTATDRIETIILNLIRGTSTRGLSTLNWIRPISPLYFSRSFCITQQKLANFTDRSNKVFKNQSLPLKDVLFTVNFCNYFFLKLQNNFYIFYKQPDPCRARQGNGSRVGLLSKQGGLIKGPTLKKPPAFPLRIRPFHPRSPFAVAPLPCRQRQGGRATGSTIPNQSLKRRNKFEQNIAQGKLQIIQLRSKNRTSYACYPFGSLIAETFKRCVVVQNKERSFFYINNIWVYDDFFLLTLEKYRDEPLPHPGKAGQGPGTPLAVSHRATGATVIRAVKVPVKLCFPRCPVGHGKDKIQPQIVFQSRTGSLRVVRPLRTRPFHNAQNSSSIKRLRQGGFIKGRLPLRTRPVNKVSGFNFKPIFLSKKTSKIVIKFAKVSYWVQFKQNFLELEFFKLNLGTLNPMLRNSLNLNNTVNLRAKTMNQQRLSNPVPHLYNKWGTGGWDKGSTPLISPDTERKTGWDKDPGALDPFLLLPHCPAVNGKGAGFPPVATNGPLPHPFGMGGNEVVKLRQRRLRSIIKLNLFENTLNKFKLSEKKKENCKQKYFFNKKFFILESPNFSSVNYVYQMNSFNKIRDLIVFLTFRQILVSNFVHIARYNNENLSFVNSNTRLFGSCKLSNKQLCVFRPLLFLNRFDVKQLCTFWKLPVYPDYTNDKLTYYRNRVRKQLLPLLRFFFNPQIDKLFLQFAEIANTEQIYLNFVSTRLQQEFQIKKEKSFELNMSLFHFLPLAIRRRLLKQFLDDSVTVTLPGTARAKKVNFFQIDFLLNLINRKKK